MGHKYRYFFNDLPKYGHMDVLCTWDTGQQEIDTYELSSNVHHSRRIDFLRSKRMVPSNKGLEEAVAQWRRLNQSENNKQLDLDIIRDFILTLSPLSVHDFKPMLILTQEVLRRTVDQDMGQVVSTKLKQEYAEKVKPHIDRVKELEAEVAALKLDVARLETEKSEQKAAFDAALAAAEQAAAPAEPAAPPKRR